MMTLRSFKPADWPAVWQVIQPVFRDGATCAFSPDISEEDAYQAWIVMPLATFVATDSDSQVLGTYFLKANQPGLGSHVANCGYIVGERARGRGVAARMCEHSQEEAIRRGFRAMQFNLVVSANEAAVHLWQKLGFQIVGTLPGAFRHRTLGYIDAFVMYKRLVMDGDDVSKRARADGVRF